MNSTALPAALHVRPRIDASDDELVARTLAGDPAAFEAIIRRHNRLLFRTARSVLRSDAEAEDVVQETYFKAWRKLPSFRREARLSTWLVRIAMNEAFGRLRRSRAEVVTLAGWDGAQETDMTADEAPSFDAPETAALRHEFRQVAERHIDALPAQYRIVFVLRVLEELDVEEVAQLLRVPPATVRTRFFRARSRLRESLAQELDLAIEDAFAFAGERCDRIVRRVMAAIESGKQSPQASES